MATHIDMLKAQDAYWYAQSCAADGAGDVFTVGDHGEPAHLLGMWRDAVSTARAAGIDLSGLELVRGTIVERGKALCSRIYRACQLVGGDALTGTYREFVAEFKHVKGGVEAGFTYRTAADLADSLIRHTSSGWVCVKCQEREVPAKR